MRILKTTQGKLILVALVLLVIVLGLLIWANRANLSSSAATVNPTPTPWSSGGFNLVKLPAAKDISAVWNTSPWVSSGQHYTLVDDIPSNDISQTNTDYIWANGTGSNSEIMGFMSQYGIGKLTSVNVRLMTKCLTTSTTGTPSTKPSSSSPSPSSNCGLTISPNIKGEQRAINMTPTAKWFTGSWSYAPPTGVTWDQNVLNNITVKLTSTGTGFTAVGSLWIEITYSKTNFKPDTIATRAILADAVARTFNKNLSCKFAPYKDVPVTYWACDKINALKNANIMIGYGDGTFKPEDQATRAMLAVVIARAMNLSYDSASPSFKDVPRTYWAYKEIEGMNRAGFMKGYGDGTFKPDDKASRATVAVVISRATNNSYSPAVPTFLDVPTNYWAFKEIEGVNRYNIMRP